MSVQTLESFSVPAQNRTPHLSGSLAEHLTADALPEKRQKCE